MDASSYGQLVEGGSGGNYATGGFVGEHGPEIVWTSGGCYLPAAGLVSRLDTSATVARLLAGGFTPDSAWRAVTTGDRDPDDGSAGVPAKL